MKIILIPTGFILTSILWALIKAINIQTNQRLSILQGLQHIRNLRRLIEHIPQHRGMANALLNGDDSFKEKISELQSSIQNDISQTESSFQKNKLNELLHQHWIDINTSWHKLQKELHNINAAESFELHSDLVIKIIYLIGDICDEYKISTHPDEHIRNIANTTFNQIPEIIELCGQSRGIGTGAVAKGRLTTTNKIKIEFLYQRLQETQQIIVNNIKSNNLSKDNTPLIAPEITNASASQTEQFIGLIKNQLLTGEKISIAANDYFEAGSRAIESNLKIFDSVTSLIENSHKK